MTGNQYVLDIFSYLFKYQNMEPDNVIASLSALAHETRLKVFRNLVQAGPLGLAAGELARRLEVAPATLTFHLKELMHSGLATSRRDGRSIIYTADYDAMESVIGYLTENCCRESACTNELVSISGDSS